MVVPSTSGASGSSKGKSGGFEWPERVVSGNAIALITPLQFGFVGYMPRVRLGIQYDYQLHRPNWLHVGVAALFDRGGFSTFGLDGCGLGDQGACTSGTVAGFDLWAGYTYKWYLEKHPFVVPFARGSVGGGWWKYPTIGGSRNQSIDWSGSGSLRLGGGVRLFLLDQLGLGLDLAFTIGFTRSREQGLAAEATHVTRFLFGMEILPLIVEYRF